MNWDLGELVTETQDLLNSTSNSIDVDFSEDQVKQAIRRAYTREVRAAKLHGMQEFFKVVTTETWPASQTTFIVPDYLQGVEIIKIEDITDSDPGRHLSFSKDGARGDVFWLDYRTLQWNSSSPSSDRSLRFSYYADYTPLVADGDKPYLIPTACQEILMWSAAIDLRQRKDEEAPYSWMASLNDLRMDFWKVVSRGRPMRGNTARVNPAGSSNDYLNEDYF